MFFLIDENNKCYRIKENEETTIGRTASDITLKIYRIGRQHAKILSRNGEVFVVDLKSINGTKINDEEISTDTLTKFDVGSTLNLASAIDLKLQKLDLTVSSFGLTSNETSLLKKHLNDLNGVYQQPNITNDCTFLVCNQIEFSLDFVRFLHYNVQFVKLKYFADLNETFTANKPLPNPDDYLPLISSNFPQTVDRNFFDFNQKRQNLFCGKTFIGQMDSDLIEFIEAFSGTVSANCDRTRANIDNVFLISSIEKDNVVTIKDLMLAILYVDCQFLTARNKKDNRTKESQCKDRTEDSIINRLTNVNNIYGCSEDVFSSELVVSQSQRKTKRIQSECTNFVNKKQCSSTSVTNYDEPIQNSVYTLNILNECYPDISVVKWTLTDN